jgi:hypothetical protein
MAKYGQRFQTKSLPVAGTRGEETHMNRRMVLGAATIAALMATAPAVAQPAPISPGDTVTATGTGQSPVLPKNRNSNASIAAAYERARTASIAGALKQAHEYAEDYAKAVRLKLGGVISVSDAQANGFYGYGPGAVGPFGPSQFCGTVRQPVGKPAKGQKPALKTVHRCFVPRFAFITLSVTYSAS